ncbi:PREDICTED: inactive serine protease PAMR1 [Nanorana parkeri]|uniref:inactive serine protease PAMR1 n=1 Tax=Nanorana parkeri TaxID=125878 RepID=UPI000853FEB3|nr:PREDICTED: inactive serine protease PAMR1 [Nanorana parkeri]
MDRTMTLLLWTSLLLSYLYAFHIAAYPKGSKYTVINENCPGAEWNIMCRDCCEYDQVECTCPGGNKKVGYTIPCCRNEDNECDSCLIHPGCTIFDNCKSCYNGSWGGTLDDFYVKGKYCSECRIGWYGGDCMRCGEVIQAARGEIMMESYPFNAHCEWSIQVTPGYTIELRFAMLSLEFDYMCQYDYLEIRDGDNVDAKIIKRFCGNERPLPIRSSGNALHLLFRSDGSKSFDGFYATFQEVTVCSPSPCFHDGTCIVEKTGYYKCACLAGYTGRHCENVLEEKSCADPGPPLNGYRKLSEQEFHRIGNKVAIGSTVHYFCNNSHVLSGNQERKCLETGQWSGKQPVCIKACREPKIPDLVRQKVLPSQVQSRETPIHQLYSSSLPKEKSDVYPTKKPALPPGELPKGHHHLHTQLQYECASQFYKRTGSSRRTCLKTGKWSGRAPSCIPICGKLGDFTVSRVSEMRWPWQAALYRRSNGVRGANLRKGTWVLVCSGALLNERTAVIAAHCVTDLGKSTIIKVSDLKVVLGKFHRDDERDEKSQQHLHISAIIVHPNYDPVLLDSDIAVIKLLDKARVSDYVQPVCLASSPELDSTTLDSRIVTSGWRILSDPKAPGYKNETLRAGLVLPVDSLLCEQQYEENGISVSVTESMFCAKQVLGASTHICPSETGGIAATLLPESTSSETRWHLMGLVSWGYDKTCHRDLYTGYTKVTTFKEWLERNMK